MGNLAGVNATRLTADGTVGGGLVQGLCGVLVEGDNTSAGIVSVYDGSSASGTLLFVIDVAANATNHIDLGCPVAINSGSVHIVLGGTADPDAVTVFWK